MDLHRVRELSELPIAPGTKGLPLDSYGLTLGEVASSGWQVLNGDLPMPSLVLKESALSNNLAAMATYARSTGALLCPHGKTTMAPQLFARQIEAGAWGMTAATPAHLAVYRHYGVQRIIFANQLIEPHVIRWLDRELARYPDFEFYCLVDSPDAIDALEAHLSGTRRVNVLLEVGHAGGRCGVRDLASARRVADRVETSSRLVLRGIECFEGLIARADMADTIRAVDEFLSFTQAVARDLVARTGLREAETVLVSAGGSAYFDRVSSAFDAAGSAIGRAQLILRSGCYLTQDGGFYDEASPLAGRAGGSEMAGQLGGSRPAARVDGSPPAAETGSPILRDAIEVWSTVLSRPERNLVITSMGRRDVPYDMGLPKAVRRAPIGGAPRPLDGARVTGLNDQHAHITVPSDSSLAPGELVGCAISHPCGAFDRWRVILVVDDDYRVTDAVATCF